MLLASAIWLVLQPSVVPFQRALSASLSPPLCSRGIQAAMHVGGRRSALLVGGAAAASSVLCPTVVASADISTITLGEGSMVGSTVIITSGNLGVKTSPLRLLTPCAP